jgi:hypothetical protein
VYSCHMRLVRTLTAAALAGAACVVLDQLHVTEGVLFYPHPAIWGQAWWVFPLFFSATLAIFAGLKLVHPKPLDNDPPLRAATGDFIALVTAYAFTAFAASLPNVVLCVLLGTWVARAVRGMPGRHIVFCILCALIGSAFEAMLSGAGGFTYYHPDFLGVPRWLPALYLHAAVAGDSARRVVDGNPLS